MAGIGTTSAEFFFKAKPVPGPGVPARASRAAVQVVTHAALVSSRAWHTVSRAFLHIPAWARSCDAAIGSNAKPVRRRHYRDRGQTVYGVEVIRARYLVGDASSVAKNLVAPIISYMAVVFNTYFGYICIFPAISSLFSNRRGVQEVGRSGQVGGGCEPGGIRRGGVFWLPCLPLAIRRSIRKPTRDRGVSS
jgi:hypothetical protein